MFDRKPKNLTPAKKIAYTAVACALLIGGQLVFSAVSGVEIVTLILACFAFCFGARCGAVCAVAFSLLRCAVFGFEPTVVILYLLYYPAFAAAFGLLGKIKDSTFDNFPLSLAAAVNAIFIIVAAVCAVVYFCDLLVASRIVKATLNVFLIVIICENVLLLIAFDALFIIKRAKKRAVFVPLKVIFVTSVAIIFTICFTLLDDLITPLIYGWSQETMLAYFYSSFAAMLPQTVCTGVTFTILFAPVCSAMAEIAKR